jgi:hypothetical protein
MVVWLKRSLPWLKQAGCEWAAEQGAVFTDVGFSRSKVDKAVYYKCAPNEHIVITVPVYDMAVAANHISHIHRFKADLKRVFQISNLGKFN